MKRKWKSFLIALLMLPMVVFFSGYGCGQTGAQTTQRVDMTYTVKFYTDSKQTFNIASQVVKEGQLVRRPIEPIKTGYDFIGWYKDKNFEQIWTFELDTVHGDMTLYAKWKKRGT